MQLRPGERPAKAPAFAALTGLSSAMAERPAIEALASVSWRGFVPDPNTTSAREFLGTL